MVDMLLKAGANPSAVGTGYVFDIKNDMIMNNGYNQLWKVL